MLLADRDVALHLKKCLVYLKQILQNSVFHQIRHRDLQLRLSLHGALDGEGGAFVPCPVAAGNAVVDIPMVFKG